MRGSGSSDGWRAVEFVEGNDPEGLQAAGPLHRLDDDPRALVGDLVAVAAQAGHVEKDVGQAVIRQDEAEALGHVEPLDPTADLDQIQRRLRGRILRDLATAVILRSFLAEVE